MKYIVCEQPGKLAFGSASMPIPKEGEVLVKIRRIGICGTDLHAYMGNQAFFSYPRILGHELAGVVQELGPSVSRMSPGDQVLIMPYVSCGRCQACLKEKTNCCENLIVLGVHEDGGMKEFMSLPQHLLMICNELSLEELAIVEPLAIGAHAVRRAQIRQGERVVVVGCGPIGIGIIAQAKLLGADVIALDVQQSRLDFLRSKYGIEKTLLVTDDSIEQVREAFGGQLADTVFDATGNKQALEQGIYFMDHGGKYVIVGLSKGNLSLHHPTMHAREITLLCSRNATLIDFERVVELLMNRSFLSEHFITHRLPFDDMVEHFAGLTEPGRGVIKAIVDL